MKRIASTIVASMTLITALGLSGAAQAAERPNVLIMGEDIDREIYSESASSMPALGTGRTRVLVRGGWNRRSGGATLKDSFRF